jgi:hypothetical protein
MNKTRSIIVICLIFTVALGVSIFGLKAMAFTNYLINDDFEKYTVGNYSTLNGSDGNATWQWSGALPIVQDGNNKYLSTNGTVSSILNRTINDGICTIEFKTKTMIYSSDQNRITFYDNNNKTVVQILITDRKITYSNELSADGISVSSPFESYLYPNTLYNIKAVINMNTKRCELYYGIDKTNMTYFAERPLKLYGNGSSPNYSIASSIYRINLLNYGISQRYFDDFSLSYDDGRYVDKVNVNSSANVATIPLTGSKDRQFSASTLDNLGNSLSQDSYTWSILPEKAGISINSDGLLTIMPNAETGFVDIIAKSTIDSNVSGKFTIEIVVSAPSELKLSASSTKALRVPFQNEPNSMVSFSCIIKDKEGNALSGYETEYSINNTQGIILNKTDGNNCDISVDSTALGGQYILTAQVVGLPSIKATAIFTIEKPIPKTIIIHGNKTITAQKTQSVVVKYLATVSDQFDIALSGQKVDWSITNGYNDASISGGNLILNANAKEGTIEISAYIGEIICKKTIVVSYRQPAIARIDLNTVETVEISPDRTKAVKLYADVYDVEGNLLTGQDILWSITNSNLNCSIDEKQGILYVYPNSISGILKIKATLRIAQILYKETEIILKQASNNLSTTKLSLRSQEQIIELPANAKTPLEYIVAFVADVKPLQDGINDSSSVFLLSDNLHPKYISISNTIDTDTGLADAITTQGIELLRATYAGKLALIGLNNNVIEAIYTEQANMPTGYNISDISDLIYNANQSTLGGKFVGNIPIFSSAQQSGAICDGTECFKTSTQELLDNSSYSANYIFDLKGNIIAVAIYSSTLQSPSSSELKFGYLTEIRKKGTETYCEFVESDKNIVRRVLSWAQIDGITLSGGEALERCVLIYTIDLEGNITKISSVGLEYNGDEYRIQEVNNAQFNSNNTTFAGYDATDLVVCGTSMPRNIMDYAFYNRLGINELSESTIYDLDIVINSSKNQLIYALAYGGLYKKPAPTSNSAIIVDQNYNKILMYVGNDFIIEDLAEKVYYTYLDGNTKIYNSIDINLKGMLVQYSKDNKNLVDCIRVLAVLGSDGIDTNQMPVDLQNTRNDYFVNSETTSVKLDGFTKCAPVISINNGILYSGETQPVAFEQNTPVLYCNIANWITNKPYCGFTTMDALQKGEGTDDQLFVYKYAGQTYCAVIFDFAGDNNVECINAQLEASSKPTQIESKLYYGLLTNVISKQNNALLEIVTSDGMKSMYLSPCIPQSYILDNLSIYGPMLIEYTLDIFGDVVIISDSESIVLKNKYFVYNSSSSTLGEYKVSPNDIVIISNNSHYTAKTVSSVLKSGATYYFNQVIIDNDIKIIYLGNSSSMSGVTTLPPMIVTNFVANLDENNNLFYKIGGYYGNTVVAYRTKVGINLPSLTYGAVILPTIDDDGEIVALQYIYNMYDLQYNNSSIITITITHKIGCLVSVNSEDMVLFDYQNNNNVLLGIKNAFVYNYNGTTGKITFASLNQNSIGSRVAYLLVGSTPCIFIINGQDIAGNYDLANIPLAGSTVAANIEYTRNTAEMPNKICVAVACYERDENNHNKLITIKVESFDRYIALGQKVLLQSFVQIPENTSRISAYAFSEFNGMKPISTAVTLKRK